MNRKGTVKVNLCNTDNDCKRKNQMCGFDTNDLKHKCIPANKKILYQGCLNTKKYNQFDKIETNSEENTKNIKTCIDFVRQQKNKDGFFYNYMIFKNKKNAFVDPNTINVYLKCNKELILVMPSKDFFTMECDDKQQRCVLRPNSTFMTFIQTNKKTCGGKLSLDVEYACENENLQNTLHIPLHMDRLQDLKIELSCPVDMKDDKFQSKCVAAYFDTQNSNPGDFKYLELLDKNVKPDDCVQPVYKVPMLIDDIDVYKQIVYQKQEGDIQDYNIMLKEKEDELDHIRAKKLKIRHKLETGRELSDEEALRMVEYNKTEYFDSSSPSCVWKIHDHKHGLHHFGLIEEEQLLKYTTPVEGKIYSIEEAKNRACQLNASLFLWFSNTYYLSNIRNKMYIIMPSQLNEIEKTFGKNDWKKWESVQNVYTGVLTTESQLLQERFDTVQQVSNDTIQQLYNQFATYFDKNVDNTDEKIQTNQNKLQTQEDQIKTITQQIKMNQYETSINNQMLTLLIIAFLILLILSIGYYVYKKIQKS